MAVFPLVVNAMPTGVALEGRAGVGMLAVTFCAAILRIETCMPALAIHTSGDVVPVLGRIPIGPNAVCGGDTWLTVAPVRQVDLQNISAQPVQNYARSGSVALRAVRSPETGAVIGWAPPGH